MSQIIPVSTTCSDLYDQQISPEYRFEKPAIDRLLDYVRTEEARKPAIDKLIEEYFQSLGLPVISPSAKTPTVLSSSSSTEHEHHLPTSQTTPQRTTLQHYPSAPSFYHTPMSSIADPNHPDDDLSVAQASSTPLLQPLSNRSYRSASTTTDRRLTPHSSFASRRISFSSNQEFPIADRSMYGNKDVRLKRAAAHERRQATRQFGKVQPGLIWTSPLPVRVRPFSLRPAALSCKIFLGGIPHDLHPRDLQERLESFGPVRLEWPNVDHMHRNSSNMMAGFVYAIYEHEESVRKILQICSTKTDRIVDDGRCEYYLEVCSSRMHSRRKSIQIIPWFVDDSQWVMEGETNNAEQRYNSSESIHRTVFVGALHGMMTAYALAKICQELFGDVEYAAIDTDRNRYPIGSGRVTFVNTHSYYAAVTANYLLIECDKFCKVIQIDPYLSDSVLCAGANDQWCSNIGQYFCRSLKCMKYYCAQCWDLNPHHQHPTNGSAIDHEPPAMMHKPLMRNARTP